MFCFHIFQACFSFFLSPYAMQIILGDHDLRVFEGTEQLLKTENIIWHPQWVNKKSQVHDRLIGSFSAEKTATLYNLFYISLCAGMITRLWTTT